MSAVDAIPTVLWADERCRVTSWVFPPYSRTGMHGHEYDYVVGGGVPVTGGQFVAAGLDGKGVQLAQAAGEAYFRYSWSDARRHQRLRRNEVVR